ncbi:hypothetical protein TIFTF001_016464 [Ficus carica]|uniref:Uncharacterized protein n=1 Tax=Ficus carica TaxID=3494 RepID=A0AA88A0E1_FICCA|nr:hypothetical protein TIFTF001_016464 [Ficus carica]
MLMPETIPAATPNVIGRSSRTRVLEETRSGQLPRAPDGRLEPRPARAIGPIDWRHMGPDSTRGTEGWLSLAPAWADPARAADGYKDKASVSCDERWRVGSEDLCRCGIYCSDSGARSITSSERVACSGENGERGQPMILFSVNVRLFGRFLRKRGLFTLPSVVGNGILWSE